MSRYWLLIVSHRTLTQNKLRLPCQRHAGLPLSFARCLHLPLSFACVCFLSSFFPPLRCSRSVEENNFLFLSIMKRNWSGNFPGDKSQLFRLPTTALNRWIVLILFFLFLLLPSSFLPSAGHLPAPTSRVEADLRLLWVKMQMCQTLLSFFVADLILSLKLSGFLDHKSSELFSLPSCSVFNPSTSLLFTLIIPNSLH